jgi:hypothetical protein
MGESRGIPGLFVQSKNTASASEWLEGMTIETMADVLPLQS